MNEQLRRGLKKGIVAGGMGGAILLANPLITQGFKDFEVPNITWNGSNINGTSSLEIKGDRLVQLAGYAVLDVIAVGTVIFVSKKK